MKRQFALFLLVTIGALSCKPGDEEKEQPVPDPTRQEVITPVLKDIETEQAPLSFQYTKVINERTNQVVSTKFDKSKTSLDVSFARQAIEEFIKEHPTDYQLYIRFEFENTNQTWCSRMAPSFCKQGPCTGLENSPM